MSAFGVDALIQRIATFLEAEARLIGQASDLLREIEAELVSMRSFLEDTKKIRDLTQVDRAWVADVRKAANTVEDIIDQHAYYLSSQRQITGKFSKFLYRTSKFPQNIWVKNRLAHELQKVITRIKAISERRQRFDVHDRIDKDQPSSSFDARIWARNRAEAALLFKEDDLVGIDDDRRLLVQWLTDTEPQRVVISVVGMGGSGKTTLAAKVFRDRIVMRHFDCYAWITVSETYVIDDLLRRMIKEFFKSSKQAIPEALSTMTLKELQEMVHGFLQPKRYVLVLDDVWSRSLWSEIEVSLPDEGLGSRLLLTTRDESIASSSFGVKTKSFIHSIKPLGKNEAWSLFCMKAFSTSDARSCPSQLEALADSLVARCNGLTLAIVVLGGVMSSKKSDYSQWRQVVDSLNWELNNNPQLGIVKQILLLSFSNLPHRLKRCFLYCCLFPEDYWIYSGKISRLWIAEGFVENVEGLTPEDVARGYLLEIVSRSMLHVVERDPRGRPFKCKMHDLFREVAISTSAIENFCTSMLDPHKFASLSHEENATPCRASIQVSASESTKPWKGMPKLRSLLLFSINSDRSLKVVLPNGLRLLTVLDLKDCPITELPEELVSFYNLRYLSLNGTKVTQLPTSIGRLRNLQFLDTGETDIKMLPSGITKLQNLRYLNTASVDHDTGIIGKYYCVGVPSNISELKNLQDLYGIEAEPNLLKKLKDMTQLKSIVITKLREVNETDFCIAVDNMSLLQTIAVQAVEEEYLCLDAISTPPPQLYRLHLLGKINKVPGWVVSLDNLTVLILSGSKLKLAEDPLASIQHLPSLAHLYLQNAYVGNCLHFSTGFLKLSKLVIWIFPQLTEIIIDKGVMPGLETMELGYLEELKMLPDGIQHLTHLQRLVLDRVGDEVANRIRGNQSVDRDKVKHIPEIKYWSPTGNYESLSNI